MHVKKGCSVTPSFQLTSATRFFSHERALYNADGPTRLVCCFVLSTFLRTVPSSHRRHRPSLELQQCSVFCDFLFKGENESFMFYSALQYNCIARFLFFFFKRKKLGFDLNIRLINKYWLLLR